MGYNSDQSKRDESQNQCSDVVNRIACSHLLAHSRSCFARSASTVYQLPCSVW